MYFYGDYAKHDFVLMTGLALSILHDTTVNIIAEDISHYRHLGGDMQEVVINSPAKHDIVLYDCRKVIVGEGKTILCTDHSKHAIESIRSLQSKVEVEGFLVCDQGSSIAAETINAVVGDSRMIVYPQDTVREVDVLFEGRFTFKGIDQNFIKAVSKVLIDIAGEDKSEVKQMWTYLGKRG